MKIGTEPCAVRSAAAEINRLHDEVIRFAAGSGRSLRAAVVSAWRAGHMLMEEKRRVRRLMGRGAWSLWLEQNFRGTPRTAQRYMALARGVTDVSFVEGMSLRTLYARLGIATELKSPARSLLPRTLPRHVTLAGRLLCALRSERAPDGGGLTGERLANFQRDLRPLYDELRPIFEPAGAARSDSPTRAAAVECRREGDARL